MARHRLKCSRLRRQNKRVDLPVGNTNTAMGITRNMKPMTDMIMNTRTAMKS
jgi:hypothetical protein